MKKFFLLLTLWLFGIAVVPAFSAQNVKTEELFKDFKSFDGKLVVVEGEVVGDIIYHRSGAWINVNDDVYARKSIAEGNKPQGPNSGIGIWISKKDAKKIRYAGDYFHKGDIVRVEGIFNSNCPEHNGEVDIHARELVIVEPGRRIKHEIDVKLAVIAIGMFIFTAIGYSIRRFHITAPGFRRSKV